MPLYWPAYTAGLEAAGTHSSTFPLPLQFMSFIHEGSSKSAPAANVGSTPITQQAHTAHYSSSAPSLSKQELNTLQEVANTMSENNMYEPFRYAHGMIFMNTSSSSVKDTFPLKPDFCLYEEATETSKKMDFSTAELCIELKPHMLYDPFMDLDLNASNDPFERDTVHANNM
ncbi:hypothetical protein F5J12DRAFT_784137 [Pisolithus orientalis]|uniref:uncharacterized protein n=1 Tax=Pisolithus orientalis TaxID=936130 RepID=UPI002224FD89|nr:uncharacterized protein F5J12DRAFT_784137 [Pisolithus orientalis]KAI6001622.1 hypothetical protein F5J12DRAFT_784137 [Pisolithus orientalis]